MTLPAQLRDQSPTRNAPSRGQAISTRRGDSLTLELPAAATLDSLFESLGVSDGSRIVLYWAKDWYSPTTRVFLTLEYPVWESARRFSEDRDHRCA